MKKLFTIFISSFFIFTLQAQEIPNGGFEDWLPTLIWTNNPLDWTTDNTEVSAPVYPDSTAYSGELCMTLTPDVNGLGEGDAIAETTFEFTDTPDALTFYARWDYIAGQVGLTVSYLNGTEEVTSSNWSPSDFESSSVWQLIQITLPQEDILFTHCKISCYALVGDLATATISFDDMQFGVFNDIDELDNELFAIGPNPSANQLNLIYDHSKLQNTQINIFDIEGRLVYQNRISQTIDISSLENGNYIVQLIYGDQVTKKQITVIK